MGISEDIQGKIAAGRRDERLKRDKGLRVELMLQHECFSWFNLGYSGLPYGFFHVPNELVHTNEEARRISSSIGIVAGVADIVLMVPGGRCVFVELKSRVGVLSPMQKRFKAYCEEHGFRYYVCRDLEEFKTVCRAEIPSEYYIPRIKAVKRAETGRYDDLID